MNVKKVTKFDGPVKSQKSDDKVKRFRCKARKYEGMRRTYWYAAMTEDAAQRSIWTFYEVVKFEKNTYRHVTMTTFSRHVLIPCALLCLLTACATLNARKTAQIKIGQAQQEIPEDQLLDVGITVFESDEITEKRAKQEGTNLDVRKAENHFIPYHLKNTLEQSGYWGMVRVTPLESEAADVLVTGEIIESNGENLTVSVVATDARGTVWLNKKYKATVTDNDYKNTLPGQHDPFQGLYNTIANDMAHHMKKLSSDEIKTVRTIAKLQFAKDFAPQRF